MHPYSEQGKDPQGEGGPDQQLQLLLEEEQAKRQAEEEEQGQPQVQVQVQVPVPAAAALPGHTLPEFTVTGEFQTNVTLENAVVTTSAIQAHANIDRRVVGAEIGTDLGWVQTMFSARMQADYHHPPLQVYGHSLVRRTTEPVIDGNDNDDIWYGDPRRFDGGDPFIGIDFYDSPQFSVPLASPLGGRLTRFSGSWEFGCWLVTRSQNLRSKFLYHQIWTASFHAERVPQGLELSNYDLTLGDAGPGPGTVHPLMDGPPSTTFLDAPGTWIVLDAPQRLPPDGVDFT
ncbi:hypothetical protein [Sphaerisporangium aureirubrum]|uniref:Uncharacterized protein n=1 Tax=Sphaerisporangium aureirubrum TaxID=1544736 RepID=A0ABW1NKW7_9ACTN